MLQHSGHDLGLVHIYTIDITNVNREGGFFFFFIILLPRRSYVNLYRILLILL
jgi:hypothetical protein